MCFPGVAADLGIISGGCRKTVRQLADGLSVRVGVGPCTVICFAGGGVCLAKRGVFICDTVYYLLRNACDLAVVFLRNGAVRFVLQGGNGLRIQPGGVGIAARSMPPKE